MRRRLTFLVVVFAGTIASLPGMAMAPQGKQTSVNSPASGGCSEPEAGTPEVYSYFGNADRVLKKLGSVNVDLPNRKIYAIMVEGPDGANVMLYERASKGKVNLRRWSGKAATQLREAIEQGIMSNRGVNCVGEQTKAQFLGVAKTNIITQNNVASPVTVKAAVSHTLQAQKDKFVRVTVILLC